MRMVSGAPEPMTVLVYNWSLDDIERFCTKSPCTVLSVDPTFNLGDFDVTVTTYCHLLLTNSRGRHQYSLLHWNQEKNHHSKTILLGHPHRAFLRSWQKTGYCLPVPDYLAKKDLGGIEQYFGY